MRRVTIHRIIYPDYEGSRALPTGPQVIRSEQEETERNLAIKALVNKYGKAIEHRLEHTVIAGIKNEIEELLK